MESTSHPTVSQLKEAIQAKGATLACTICGREEFSMEEAQLRGTGSGQYLGNYRLSRSQVICENCGHVMSFEIDKLQ